MNAQDLKVGKRYLIRTGRNELCEAKILEISTKAVKIKWDGKDQGIWVPITAFDKYGSYEIIEELN